MKKETEADSKKITEYATSIEENYVIKENEFVVPSGVKMEKAQL